MSEPQVEIRIVIKQKFSNEDFRDVCNIRPIRPSLQYDPWDIIDMDDSDVIDSAPIDHEDL